MKKFLTVLLALSVVFTYTVGTAFAAASVPEAKDQLTATAMQTAINDAYTTAKASLLKDKTDALNAIFGNSSTKTIGSDTVSKAAVESVYGEAYDAQLKVLQTQYEKMLNSISLGQTAKADYYFEVEDDADTGVVKDAAGAIYYGINTKFVASTVVFSNLFKIDEEKFAGTKVVDVAKAQVKLAKEDALKAVRAIDLTGYSKEYKNNEKSNYDLAAMLQQAAIVALNNVAIDSAVDTAGKTVDEVLGYMTTAVTALDKIYTAPVNQKAATGSLYATAAELAAGTFTALLASPYNTISLATLDKVADEPTQAVKLDWAKGKVLGSLTVLINDWMNTSIEAQNKIILDNTIAGTKGDAQAIANAKTAIEDLKQQGAAALEVATYLVQNTTKLSDLITEAKPFSTSAILVGEGKTWNFKTGTLTAPSTKATYDATTLAKISKHVTELKQEAENKKASVLIDGSAYVAIEKALENAIDDCYVKGLTENTLGVTDAQSNVWDRQKELVSNKDNTVVVNNRKYATVETWAGSMEKTGADKYAEENFDKVRAAIQDAVDKIDAAKTVEEADAAFLAGLDAVAKIPTIADRTAAQSTKEFADLKAQYEKEIDAYVDYKSNAIAATGTADKYSFNAATLKASLKADLAKAYTVDELKAKFTEAKATVDGIKTIAQLTEEKAALDKRVTEIPATVTAADKATVLALKKDIAAFNDYCDTIGNVGQKVIITAAVDNAYNKVKDADAQAIKDAIKAIGTVTSASADAIKAVRTQLDAYVKDYAGENAKKSEIDALKGVEYLGKTVAGLEADLDVVQVNAFKVMVGKLAADGKDTAGIKAARAAFDALSRDAKITVYRSSEYDKLLDLEKLVQENLKKGVMNTTLKVSSKATKGKITVTIKKSAGYKVDGYKIYRSTKQFSGFKLVKTTTKNTYKNTLVKKGTKYYYKVVGYRTINGEKVTTKYSNKAIRVAK